MRISLTTLASSWATVASSPAKALCHAVATAGTSPGFATRPAVAWALQKLRESRSIERRNASWSWTAPRSALKGLPGAPARASSASRTSCSATFAACSTGAKPQRHGGRPTAPQPAAPSGPGAQGESATPAIASRSAATCALVGLAPSVPASSIATIWVAAPSWRMRT